jgi:integrase
LYAKTKQAALSEMARLRSKMVLMGDLGEPHRLTLAAFVERWLADTVRPSVRPKTVAYYVHAVRPLVEQCGGVALAKLSPVHLQGAVSEMGRRGCSAYAQRTTIRVAATALQQAVKWGLIPRNPATVVTKPRVAAKEMQTLTPEQVRRFLEAARGDRFYALYALLIGTGLRVGEALGLSWPDVDLGGAKLAVRRQLDGDRLIFSEPKTSAARRTVDLPAFAVEALRQHLRRMEEEGHLLTDRLLVFVDGDGGPVRLSNLRRRSFLPLLKQAGIVRVRIHDLRHTFATLSLAAGVHPRVVQQSLGHANVSVTLQVYSAVLPTLGPEAAARLDRLVRGGG